MQWTAKTGDTE